MVEKREKRTSVMINRADEVYEAMKELAKSLMPSELAEKAYGLYERFRPEIPSGRRGWGASGKLDLEGIRKMAGSLKGARC